MFLTTNHFKPRVIVYSWRHPRPLHVTSLCVSVQAGRSMAGSTADTSTWSMLSASETYLIDKGDWVQIDGVDIDGRIEHFWFGRIQSATHGERPMGLGGGAVINSSFTAETWGAVFREFHKEMQLAWQLYVRDMMAATDAVKHDPPPFLGLLVALLQDSNVFFPPYQAVGIVLQFLARYGGTLRQEFRLPPSFHKGGSIPLHWMIGRLNRTRKDGTQEPMRYSFQQPSGNDDEFVSTETFGGPLYEKWKGPADAYQTDARAWNFAAIAADAEPLEADPESSAWGLQDWKRYFDACKYYQSGRDVLQEASRMDDTADCWTSATDLSDAAWCNLHCTMVEIADFPPLTGSFEAHDGLVFDRRFLLSVSFKPHAHPVYQAAGTDAVSPIVDPYGSGTDKRIEADATGYSLCPKFVVDAGALEGIDLPTSADKIFSYWMTLPRSELWRGDWVDPIVIGASTNWTVPIIDNQIMGKWGHRPNETMTRYFLDRSGKSLIQHIVRKTLLQYAWTVAASSRFAGAFTMPGYDANVPRPGDVGIVRGTIDSGRETLDPSSGGLFPRGNVNNIRTMVDLIEGKASEIQEALSIFIEAVTLTWTLNDQSGLWESSVFCQYSHGQMVSVSSDYDPTADTGKPYKRFFDWDEVKLQVNYWLPWKWDVGKVLADLPIDIDEPLAPKIAETMEELTSMRATSTEPEVVPQPEPAPSAPMARKKATPKPRKARVQPQKAQPSPALLYSGGMESPIDPGFGQTLIPPPDKTAPKPLPGQAPSSHSTVDDYGLEYRGTGGIGRITP
jgi:hypothetical protein